VISDENKRQSYENNSRGDLYWSPHRSVFTLVIIIELDKFFFEKILAECTNELRKDDWIMILSN
jgi:hypothetical protein